MNRPDVVLLEGVTPADVARALRASGLAISNGPFESLFVIKRVPKRFAAENVIDLTAEVPTLCRRQAGPIHDIQGIDYEPNDVA